VEAREEANRWHEQCTHMEQAREVRATQIDALIEALQAQHSTVSRLYSNPSFASHGFASSQVGHSNQPATKAESDVPGFEDPYHSFAARSSTGNIGNVENNPRRLNGSFHPYACGHHLEGGYCTEDDVIVGEDNDSNADEMAIIPSSVSICELLHFMSHSLKFFSSAAKEDLPPNLSAIR